MAKIISIIGSTGSIGRQTLEAAKNLGVKVAALSANSNIELLEKQVREFSPDIVSVGNSELAKEMSYRLKDTGVEVLWGQDGMKRVVEHSETDTVVTSVVGTAGLVPTMHAIRHKKNIALANKETLVTAGQLVMEEAKKIM